MSSSSKPVNINTVPGSNLIFNAPFNKKGSSTLKISNAGCKRMGFNLRNTNPDRIKVDQPQGAIDPMSSVDIEIALEPFDYQTELTDDKLVIEWVDAPAGSKGWQKEWFQNATVMRRKILPVVYNV